MPMLTYKYLFFDISIGESTVRELVVWGLIGSRNRIGLCRYMI